MSQTYNFFHQSLQEVDPEIYDSVRKESLRQSEGIELIASENMVSKAVIDACGSVMTNKYAEGYPTKRYYGGCLHMDEVESLAIERAKTLFGCSYANVQPHSGAGANLAVFLALLQPGDTYLSLSLDHGGHLTHGATPNISGKWFKPVHYGIDENTGYIDHQQLEEQAIKHKPKLIIAGASAYSRTIDFAKFREVADKVGAYLMVDMAHIAGLVATGHHPSPFPHAHVATSTTQKTLRGARGGIILSQDPELGKKFNSGIFPGTQGGPMMHQITGKAVAFGEALKPAFKDYMGRVVQNAKVLASTLIEGGCQIYSGGTDNHLMLLDLRSIGVTGIDAEKSLEKSGITCNKNSIPFDSEKPTITSGIRLGTPAVTTRGFGEKEIKIVGQSILTVLNGLHAHGADGNQAAEAEVTKTILELCQQFPIYEEMK